MCVQERVPRLDSEERSRGEVEEEEGALATHLVGWREGGRGTKYLSMVGTKWNITQLYKIT